MESLEDWIDRQFRHSAVQMQASLSPCGITKARPGFGQTIVPRRGAVVASPVPASYDPDPDYFFHWYRDSAVILDAVRLLLQDGSLGSPQALTYFADFVDFSRSLARLDGRVLASSSTWRTRVQPDFVRFLRADIELATVHGEAVAAETRVNADGTLDISSWPRPQNDGPASRALTIMRWMSATECSPELTRDAGELLRADLEFARKHAREPCYDIWEEEKGFHYYTLRVSAAALEGGAAWLEACGDASASQEYSAEAARIRTMLDGFWLPEQGYYRSRVLESQARSTKELDISVILAAIHAGGRGIAHTCQDPRMRATLDHLDALFDVEYAINQNRSPARGPALGRYAGDVYYSGGAYYFSTLGASEFCFRAALDAPAENRRRLIERGDAYLETVRVFTPPTGDLSEQFDKETGAQTSAKHLAWSYAAFISCIAARRRLKE